MQVTALANGMFDVTSATNSEKSYVVDLAKKTCSCPHYQLRLIGTGATCKHFHAAEKFAASQPAPTKLERAAAVAATLSDSDLRRYAAEKIGTAAGAACLLTLAARKATQQPKPIPDGVLDLLRGATEAERERALAIYL